MNWVGRNKKDNSCRQKQQSSFPVRFPVKVKDYVEVTAQTLGKSQNSVIVEIVTEKMDKESESE